MTQRTPRRSVAVPAFLGGALGAAGTALFLEIAVDNGHWWPTRVIAGLAGVIIATSATGSVARHAAERARDARDTRLRHPIPAADAVVDAVPLAIETTRDLPTDERFAVDSPGAADSGRWSSRIRFAVLSRDRTAAYSTYGHLDTIRPELPRLGRYRTGIGEIDLGERGISLGDSEIRSHPPITPDIPPQRRFRGIDRVRTAVIAPVVAFAVGFAGAGYAVHQFLPNTHGISSTIRDALSSATSDDEGATGDAEQNLKDSLEYAEELSPGASTRLSYVSINPDSTVSLRYYEPEDGKEWQIYDEGEPSEIGNATSRGTFTLSADEIPPLNAMRDEAFGYFDRPWFFELTMPDEDTLLPANHVAGQPIVEFRSHGTSEEYDTIQGTLDGSLAPFFPTENIADNYAALVDALGEYGVDPNAAVVHSFGGSGPLGQSGYAGGGSAPGQVLFAELGPGAGSLPPGTFKVSSGQFPTFNPDSTDWDADDMAELIPLSAMSADVLNSIYTKQASDQSAEKTDLRAYVYAVYGPNRDSTPDPARVKLAFITIPAPSVTYTLDGTPYADD